MTRFQLGSRVLIKNNPPWPGRIVEHRGPLGPGGADVYRVRLDGGTEIEVREDQLEAVGGRDRTADLDTLADHVIRGITSGTSDLSFSDDVRYRLASSVLGLIGAAEEGFEQYWDRYERWYTDEQDEYAMELWEALPGHIQARWSAFREAGYPGDFRSESID